MEGNKDEAIRCISIAEECILAGNKDKALKFLYKAEKLYSTQKAKDLIEKATMSKDSSSNIPSSPKCRRREPNESFRSQKRETSEYTSEQITQVERIKKCKDYYEILGVTKEAGDAEIKKAYRKLALMLHPDKNKAPGATEAFKAVGNAFGVLTNPDKRKEYDLLGAEPKTTSRKNNYYEYSRGFEADMSAEDLFNVFFGPGFGAQNTVFMRRNGFWHRPAQEDHQHTNGTAMFFQLLPVLILIVLSMMSGLFVSEPVYNLSPNSKYPLQRTTERLGIKYFVKESFPSSFEGSIQKLERTIEEEYLLYLKQNCFKEQHHKEAMIWKARHFGDGALYDKAKALSLPSCEEFMRLNSLFH